MCRLLPEDCLCEYKTEFRVGSRTRVTGLTKLTFEYSSKDTEDDAAHHFAYHYGDTLLKANKLLGKWPRFVMAAAHFAFLVAVIYRWKGRDATVVYVTDCLVSESHWTTIEDMGSGHEWYWLLAAVSLVEITNRFEFESLFDQNKWPEMEAVINNVSQRDWIGRREAIETCVDKIIAVTS
jgi:hypothetical protein